MQYDLDYEIYKYTDEQADCYVALKDFLKNQTESNKKLAEFHL